MSDLPIVERVDSAVYTVPTDAPEADSTLAWDSTTLVLATVRCGGPVPHAGALSVAGDGVPGLAPSLDAERARPFRIS
ncbi:hypothetical protein ABT075_24205 [Streptomyces sp. NPDC002677]|uniref:hypothetical protein n=1 Tax=Streptomyces sp. NPDC002677 TaxID=3154774 RepID=UPI003320C008